MITAYFWNGREAIKEDLTHRTSPIEAARLYHDMPCLEFYEDRRNAWRIGKYNYLGWKGLPKNKVPKAFRTIKLLLGLS